MGKKIRLGETRKREEEEGRQDENEPQFLSGQFSIPYACYCLSVDNYFPNNLIIQAQWVKVVMTLL